MPLKVPAGLIIAVVVIDLIAIAVILLLRRRMQDADAHLTLRTKFGPAAVLTLADDDGDPVRILAVGGSIQTATYVDDDRCYEPVFPYIKLYDRAFEAGAPIGRVLVLGGGGYAYPKHLIATRPEVQVDVVEIDPAITSLAQRYFYLDRLVEEFDTETTGRLQIHEGDARAFLERRATDGEDRYDFVLNDCFGGGKPAAELVTAEAVRAVHACLVPGGVYMTNVVSAMEGEGSALLGAIVATLGEVFAHVTVIPCPGGDNLWDQDNVMVAVTDGDWVFEGERAVDCGGATILCDADDPARTVKRLMKG